MVMPIGRDSNDTMFQAAPFNLTNFSDDCTKRYGVSPRPHWVTTYYGGQVCVFLFKPAFFLIVWL